MSWQGSHSTMGSSALRRTRQPCRPCTGALPPFQAGLHARRLHLKECWSARHGQQSSRAAGCPERRGLRLQCRLTWSAGAPSQPELRFRAAEQGRRSVHASNPKRRESREGIPLEAPALRVRAVARALSALVGSGAALVTSSDQYAWTESHFCNCACPRPGALLRPQSTSAATESVSTVQKVCARGLSGCLSS